MSEYGSVACEYTCGAVFALVRIKENFVHHIGTFSVKVPLFQGIFTPYDPLFYGSIFFANMGGGGGQNCFHI